MELPFALITVASVPLLLASAILWPRSYFKSDSFFSNTRTHVNAFISSHGHFQLYRQHVSPAAPFQLVPSAGHRSQSPPSDPRRSVRESGLPTTWYFAGFGYTAGPTDFGTHPRILLLPAWAVLLLTALPTPLYLLYLKRRRRHHRIAAGLCTRCAYDLRATPHQCPECGTPAPV